MNYFSWCYWKSPTICESRPSAFLVTVIWQKLDVLHPHCWSPQIIQIHTSMISGTTSTDEVRFPSLSMTSLYHIYIRIQYTLFAGLLPTHHPLVEFPTSAHATTINSAQRSAMARGLVVRRHLWPTRLEVGDVEMLSWSKTFTETLGDFSWQWPPMNCGCKIGSDQKFSWIGRFQSHVWTSFWEDSSAFAEQFLDLLFTHTELNPII